MDSMLHYCPERASIWCNPIFVLLLLLIFPFLSLFPLFSFIYLFLFNFSSVVTYYIDKVVSYCYFCFITTTTLFFLFYLGYVMYLGKLVRYLT